MSSWAGFSDDELRNIQQKDSAMPAAASRGRRPAPANRSRQQLQRERALKLATEKSLPPEQQLTKSPPKVEPVPQPVAPEGAPAVKQELQQKHTTDHRQVPEETQTIRELENQEVELREKTRWEQLQHEQKIMEERNKRKKALVAKTIAEKSKQTQAETVKLKRIQKELQALDDMVSNDIGLLRDLIEQASWDYSTARKRYEKAETEYVSAKLDLHRKTELKEQLTEHLCAIIQQNELRKANKLEELMQQLQLQAIVEEEKTNGSVENQEGPVQSTKACSEEENVKEERGGEVQQPQTEEDCGTIETCAQREAVAS